ncbi:unnamed protein product, partial [marine sediment metagenome]
DRGETHTDRGSHVHARDRGARPGGADFSQASNHNWTRDDAPSPADSAPRANGPSYAIS